MKLLRFLFLSIFVVCASTAKPVDVNTARNLAEKLFEQTTPSSRSPRSIGNSSRLELLNTLKAFTLSDGENPAFHIFNHTNGGFAIIAADDIAKPILAYSSTQSLDASSLPPAMHFWLSSYAKDISKAVDIGVTQSKQTEKLWESVSSTEASLVIDENGSTYLVETNWNQNPYYNADCPYDATYQENAVTGCVATAMAQIMKYWNYPSQGSGNSRYTENDYGVLSADYSSSVYNWAAMPIQLSELSTEAEVNAVALLMSDCGISVQMDYGVEGSGANPSDVPKALSRYFGYSSSATLAKRDDQKDSVWIRTLRNEIDSGRPIFYGGMIPDGQSGHAFVCDGYDTNNRFHMNWGWGGAGNGFFELTALYLNDEEGNPYFDYTNSQLAVIGIEPAQNTAANAQLRLYSNLVASTDSIIRGQPFSVSFNIENASTHGFTGTIAAVVRNSENEVLASIGEGYYEADLPAGYHYNENLVFSTEGLNLNAGSYIISLVFDENNGGLWKAVGDGVYSNSIPLTIVEATTQLQLSSELKAGNTNIIQQNAPFNVSFNVQNTGNASFAGSIAVDFYNMDGSWRSDIGTIFQYEESDLPVNYRYSEDFQVSCPGVNLTPGEYLMGITHKASNQTWETSNSGTFQNPIKVWVEIGSDPYEPNDDDFFIIQPEYFNEQATIATSGANIHHKEDEDLFLIEFPAGYDYVIDGRINDSWSSTNGIEYSADVAWVMVDQDLNTYVYDDQMDQPLILSNGGYIGIDVFGWGDETGTYDLNLTVIRTALGQGLDPSNPKNYLLPLYRFYRSDSDSYFFTSNETEKNNLLNDASGVWSFENISHNVLSTQVEGSVPVLRLYNQQQGAHFYTSSEEEANALIANSNGNYQLEGIAFYVFPSQQQGALPVYRFYSPLTGLYFFTISESEKEGLQLLFPSWMLKYEGIAWYAYE